MVDTSRRAIMRGAAGLGAAMTTSSRGAAELASMAPQYTGYANGLNAARGLMETAIDPISQAKQAAMALVQKDMEIKRAANRRALNSLNRLRSVSEAWKQSRYEHFEREDANIWDALRMAQEKIFGGGQ